MKRPSERPLIAFWLSIMVILAIIFGWPAKAHVPQPGNECRAQLGTLEHPFFLPCSRVNSRDYPVRWGQMGQSI